VTDRDSTRSSSTRDVGEDFLFHLYRGSELLQDDRVHDAKAELEQALLLQPSDPKGQDLLGIVYFRLGLYPRAIAIYERLIQMHPDAIEPRINLALSYIKTGQPAQARAELEKVVEQNPNHSRAWGYLGLAFQRLGDIERATHAFTAGGHDSMARRLLEQSASPTPPGPSVAPARKDDDAAAVVAAERPPAPLAKDAEEPRDPSGMWSSIDANLDLTPLPTPTAGPPSRGRIPREPAPARDLAPSSAPPSVRVVSATAPVRAAAFGREHLLVFPRSLPVALHQSGLVLVQAASGFITRLDLVRSMAFPNGVTATALHRRLRGRSTDEPLGGAASPLVELSGRGELVLAPAAGQKLLPIVPNQDALYLREEAVGAFELLVAWENGRVAVGDGDAVSMMLFRGDGSVIASLPERVCAIDLMEGRSAAMRLSAVLGWVGRVVPRALLASEAPAGVRGFVVFAGEGTVLLDGR
jgi:uncharacterized protein (AIM24 family)